MSASKSNKIIIIVGSPASGKSTISFELAKQLRIRNIIDTDIVRAVKITQNPDNEYINTFSFESWKLAGKKQTKKTIISGFKKYTEQIKDEIMGIIKINNNLGRTVIVEGVHLHPNLLKSLQKINNVHIFSINIDEKRHEKNIMERVKNSHNHDPKIYFDNFKSLRVINDYFNSFCIRQGHTIIKNNDIKKSIKRICEVIK